MKTSNEYKIAKSSIKNISMEKHNHILLQTEEAELLIFSLWNSNEGNGWSFDIFIQHPNVDFDLHVSNFSHSNIVELFNSLTDELEFKNIYFHYDMFDIEKVYNFLKPIAENKPQSSAKEYYYGI